MAKLHELLAVESDLENVSKNTVAEALNTFTKKPHMFFGYEKRLENFNENLPEAPRERQELTTTVKDKIDYVNQHIARYFDAVLQKECTNQIAKADIIINGNIIAKDIPATFLLGLETKFKSIRDRKSTRLNSSHQIISYAVFCLKKKKQTKKKKKNHHNHRNCSHHPTSHI